MIPIELRARREALGLSQPALAGLLRVAPVCVSGWEDGTWTIPAGIDTELTEYEEIMEQLVDHAVEAIEHCGSDCTPVLRVCDSDSQLWAAVPALDGLPAAVHRVAMARARLLVSRAPALRASEP